MKIKELKVKKFFELPTDKLWVYPVFLGTLLRFWGVMSSSIWHDEGYTMWLIRYNFGEMVARTARDVHPPGYYFFAKAWTLVFGNSELAIRSLSVLFSVGIIYLTYKIVEKLINERAAFWASLFVAFSPFMIRFSQEARMYGVVAFFTTLGTYYLVRFIQEKNDRFLIPYSLAMLVAIYTQYYAFFVILVHIAILKAVTPGLFTFKWGDSFKKRLYIFNPKVWLAGVAIGVAYLPWFFVAYKQVTRVSTSYWIRPEWITAKTVPNSVSQFFVYGHLDFIYKLNVGGMVLYWLLAFILISLPLIIFWKKQMLQKVWPFFLYGYFPMLLVFIVSKIRTPIYQDRYFPFSAVAILAIWGIAVASIEHRRLREFIGVTFITLFLVGGAVMHVETNHQMKALSEEVKKQQKEGDVVLSGELYTFLDGTYYFGDKKIRFLSDSVNGYGESSLFYDQQKDYLVSKEKLSELGDRIFVVGKNGDKDYFSECLWSGWKAKTIFEESKQGGLKAVLYTK